MSNHEIVLSRRTFIGGAAALSASAMVPSFAVAASGKPDSMFNGVQIGCITYSFRSLPGKSAEELLGYITQCGISSVELMGGPAEGFARAYNTKNPGGDPMDGFKALRKLYSDAGVNIHIVKFGNIGNPKMPGEKIERYFNIAKALGARGITRELSDEAAKRLGPIADKHEIMLGFHNHMQLKPTTYDGDILSYGKYLGINLDIGHYVAGTNEDPIALIEKHYERIVSLHIKDRKQNKGPNQPFGQGDTPVAGVLQFMAKNKLTFPADIELEYGVPKESGAIQEISKCVQFCKDALV